MDTIICITRLYFSDETTNKALKDNNLNTPKLISELQIPLHISDEQVNILWCCKQTFDLCDHSTWKKLIQNKATIIHVTVVIHKEWYQIICSLDE